MPDGDTRIGEIHGSDRHTRIGDDVTEDLLEILGDLELARLQCFDARTCADLLAVRDKLLELLEDTEPLQGIDGADDVLEYLDIEADRIDDLAERDVFYRAAELDQQREYVQSHAGIDDELADPASAGRESGGS